MANLPDNPSHEIKIKPSSQDMLDQIHKKRELERINSKIRQKELTDEEMKKEMEEESPLIQPTWKISEAQPTVKKPAAVKDGRAVWSEETKDVKVHPGLEVQVS